MHISCNSFHATERQTSNQVNTFVSCIKEHYDEGDSQNVVLGCLADVEQWLLVV